MQGRSDAPWAASFSDAEGLFRQEPRWLGGDAAYSIPLSEDRIVWLFGDSFIEKEGKLGRRGSKLVRNTISIQTGADPRSAKMKFYWGQAATNEPEAYFVERGDFWFWPAGGARIADGALLIFLQKVEAREGGLGFAITGYSIAVISNPDAAPDRWRIRILEASGPMFDAVPACVMPSEGDDVVAIAVRQNGPHAGMLVRYSAEELSRGAPPSPEWWMGDRLGWIDARLVGAQGPAVVIDDAGSECSLHYDRRARVFVHFASYGFGASEIGVRTATTLTGSWSKPLIAYRPPESDAPRAFVYAGKAHPELVGPDRRDLLVTYAANSFEFEDLLSSEGEDMLYWPRFVLVRMRFDN